MEFEEAVGLCRARETGRKEREYVLSKAAA